MLLTYFSALAARLSQNKQVSFIRPNFSHKVLALSCARQLTTVKKITKVDNAFGYVQVKA